MNTVAEQYHQLANGSIRPLDWELGVSWTKDRNADTTWFTLNQSALNGSDLLAEDSNNPIQLWDAYEYQMMRDRVIEMSLERSVQFPNNIQSAVLDVTLNNYDGYISVDNPDTSLAGNIRPARPIRAYLGFRGAGVTPVFVGLTQRLPTYTGINNTMAQLTAMDFLTSIGDMSIRNMIMMRDARTDQVIAAILEQFGLASHMFNLQKGINTIPFVFFDSDKNAGNALKELIQAENGAMWIDEQGIIRFAPRSALIGQESVIVYTPDNIVSITPSQSSGIVNQIYIESDIREVKENQQIFSVDNEHGFENTADDDPYRLKSNTMTTIWLNFEDPIWSGNASPLLNGDDNDSSFTVVNLSGDSVNSGVVCVGTFFAKSLKLEFTNTNAFAVSINYLQIWGEPAKVIGESPSIKYTAKDDESIEKYGLHELSITDNNCFGSLQNADSFAMNVLEQYSGYSPTLELEVKGDPSLQLQDIVTLQDTKYDGTWLIKGISHNLSDSKLTTRITVIRYNIVQPFILNKSVLNGPDVLS